MNGFKVFRTFKEGISELCEMFPSIKSFTGEDMEYESVVKKLLECIANDIPTFKNTNTLAISLNIGEIGFKTKDHYSFGCRIHENDLGDTIYSFRISFAKNSKRSFKKKNSAILSEKGWVVSFLPPRGRAH